MTATDRNAGLLIDAVVVEAAAVLLESPFDADTPARAIRPVVSRSGATSFALEDPGSPTTSEPIRWEGEGNGARTWTWPVSPSSPGAIVAVGAPEGDDAWGVRWAPAFQALAALLIAARRRHETEKRRESRRAAEMEVSRRGALSSLNETLEHRQKLREVNELLERQNRELVAANETAREAARLKSEFLANMSHELRTPLNAALGFLNLYLSNPTAPEEERRECVQTARDSSLELLSLINRVLDLANLEAGRVSVTPMEAPLSLVYEDLTASAAATAVSRGRAASLRIEEPPADDPTVVVNLPKLRDVMQELVDNALKFAPDGEVTISARSEGVAFVRLEIRDNGIGIEPARIPSLFEPFTQGEGGLNRRFSGAGLGLAVARKSLELMGGALSLESEGVGLGATAVARLPLARVDEAVPAGASTSGRSRVLSEDEPLIAAVVGLPDEMVDALRPRWDGDDVRFQTYRNWTELPTSPGEGEGLPDALVLLWNDEADLARIGETVNKRDLACVVVTTQPDSAVRAQAELLSHPAILSVFPLRKITEDPAVLFRVLTRYRRRLIAPI